jgi:hypothetical protein
MFDGSAYPKKLMQMFAYIPVLLYPITHFHMHAEFMENMQLKYNSVALAKGCFIASAVGFDCVPAEIGAALCAEALAREAGTPHHIESVLTLNWGPQGTAGHYATL